MPIDAQNYNHRGAGNYGIVVRCPRIVGDRLVYFDHNAKRGTWVIRDFAPASNCRTPIPDFRWRKSRRMRTTMNFHLGSTRTTLTSGVFTLRVGRPPRFVSEPYPLLIQTQIPVDGNRCKNRLTMR